MSGSDFSCLAQISGLSGFKFSKIRNVLVMIVVYYGETDTIFCISDFVWEIMAENGYFVRNGKITGTDMPFLGFVQVSCDLRKKTEE